MPRKPKAKASNVVITSIFPIFYKYASLLCNPRSKFYYASTYFASTFDVAYEPLAIPLHVSSFVEDSVVVDQVYHLGGYHYGP